MNDDGTMTLGEHLHELRSRLIRVILVFALVMIGSFFFMDHLQPWLKRPLIQAAGMVDDETVHALGHETREQLTRLWNRGLTDGPMALLRISFFLGLAVGFPVFVYQLWRFVVPGLRSAERSAGFLLVPAAVLFFYGGLVFGYLLGMPYLYKWIFEFNADWNPDVYMQIFQGDYYGNLFMMSILFGFVMDIPWLILVLVKARLVTPDKLARSRKMVIVAAAIAAAILTPPDPFSQMVVLAMMVCLYEVGIWASRLIYRPPVADGRGVRIGEEGLIGHMVELPGDPRRRPGDDEAPSRVAERVDQGEPEDDAAARDPSDAAEPAEEGSVAAPAVPPAAPDEGAQLEGPGNAPLPGSAGERPDRAPDEAPDPWSRGRVRRDLHRHGRAGDGGPTDPPADPEDRSDA